MLQSKHSLERHAFFPFIAWATIIGFTLFVFLIVQELRTVNTELADSRARIDAQLAVPPEEITDFLR